MFFMRELPNLFCHIQLTVVQCVCVRVCCVLNRACSIAVILLLYLRYLHIYTCVINYARASHTYSVSSLVSHLKSSNQWDNTVVVVFMADNKFSDKDAGAGGKSHSSAETSRYPFAREEEEEEEGRDRDRFEGRFEGAVRGPAFISGGFVETSLLVSGTAPHRYAPRAHAPNNCVII
jgi:hypothetical protein